MSSLQRLAPPPLDLDSFMGRKWLESISNQSENLSGITALQFLLLAVDAALPNSRRLQGNSDISLTDGGAGGNLVLALTPTGVIAGAFTKVTVDINGRITVGAFATTNDIAEAANLYFTNARARAALSGTANQILYNSGTGVFSAPQNIDAGASPSFVTVLLSNLTSGRVTFATAAGQLTDDADLTFDGVTLSSNKLALKAGSSTGNIAKGGGAIFDHYVDVGNGTTVETDLYSDTIPADVLAANGDKISAEYGGIFASSATATRQIRVYFAGTAILDTGALSISVSASWSVYLTLIRVSATVVRYTVTLQTSGASLAVYNAVGELTGLTLSGTNILKLTGQAAGVGAATDDIVAKMGTVDWRSAA